MENNLIIVLIGITLIIWCALYRYRATTAKWVLIAALLSTCLAFTLGLSEILGLGHGYIDLLSLVNVFLNAFILLAIGQSPNRGKSTHIKDV
ncbi:hypothetical protein D9543_09860 [Corynebacterium macginleyi]|uniref:Uncharacterized protein n=1 Tax=Corynebacterium macginleyi TaxID=38290 RepID=A0A3M0FWP6_9CORY|nr:hypothetical protein D9543_09860 [Corynebacterium macginleyi]